MVWSDEKCLRFHQLRERELDAELNETEAAELTALLQELDRQERAELLEATARLRAERQRVQAQNRDLRKLVERKEILAQRLERVLQEAQVERSAIKEELAHVLSSGTPS